MNSDFRIISVLVEQLVDPPSNPNIMSSEQMGILRDSIRRMGAMVQPILVREPFPGEMPPDKETIGRLGGGEFFIIVDGVHRAHAARAAGLREVPVVVMSLTEDEARVLQIGMNRVRGELDLGAVTRTLADLRASDWQLDDLTLAGFTTEDITDLLAATAVNPDEVLGSAPPEEAPEPPTDGAFELTVAFRSASDLRKVKKALRKAAGKGGELSDGLLRLLGDE